MSDRSWHNFKYISCEKAFELDISEGTSLEDYKTNARNNDKCHCGEPTWKMAAELEMCFSCVTGETDASKDYELKQ